MTKLLCLIGKLLCSFCPKEEVIEPEPDRLPILDMPITLQEVHNILWQKFGNAQYYLSDKQYYLAHHDDVAWFLANDQTDKETYVSQSYDCDDFSYRLMGQFSVPKWSDLTFGIVWTQKHALDCVINQDREFFFVEPQNDELIPDLKDSWGDIRFIMI